MAKKRGGAGSSPGLVITLVFFILATIGLGVATYYGFAEQEGLHKQIKDSKKLVEIHKAEREFYKIQGGMYKAYIGDMPDNPDAKQELQSAKEALDKNNSPLVAALKDSDKVKAEVQPTLAYLDGLGKEYNLTWDTAKGEKEPSTTFKKRLKGYNISWDREPSYAELRKMIDALEVRAKVAEGKATDQEKIANEKTVIYQGEVAAFAGKVKEHSQRYQDDLKDARDKMAQEQALRANAVEAKNTAELAKAKLEQERDKLKGLLTKAVADSRKNKDRAEKAESENRILREKAQVDTTVVDTEVQASKAAAKLKNWNRDWKIVSVERLGTVQRPLTYVYINLGSSQRVSPQLTFSVHGVEANGKLSPTAKGTIEVVRVVRANLSKALVTSERDPKGDPITKGNMIFNAIWDPTDQKRVAVVGLIDTAGDGTDGTLDFIRSLRRQGTQVDAYLDMDTLKVVTKGAGMTKQTDYLIVGSGLEGTRHRKANEKKFTDQASKAMTEMRNQARGQGVPVIDLDRYMQLTGIPAGGRAGGRP